MAAPGSGAEAGGPGQNLCRHLIFWNPAHIFCVDDVGSIVTRFSQPLARDPSILINSYSKLCNEVGLLFTHTMAASATSRGEIDMTRSLLLLCASLMIFSGGHASGQSKSDNAGGILDGMTFVGTSGEKGKPAAEPDTLKFKKGKFHSKSCDRWGFAKASYTATESGNLITFTSVTRSDSEGAISWEGRVDGETCEVHYVWTKEGQKPIEYVFSGIAKAKKMKDGKKK